MKSAETHETTLAELMQRNPYEEVNQKRLATLLKKDERTIRNLVRHGELPAPFKRGNERIWLVKRIFEFSEERLRKAQEQADGERERITKLQLGA